MLGVAFFYNKNRGGCIFEVDFGRGLHFKNEQEGFVNINNDLSIYSSIESTSISHDISLGNSEFLRDDSFSFSS